jgi:hypothetical protein
MPPCRPWKATGRVPLTDLGSGLYAGEMGGLYPDGSNLRPASHDLTLERTGRFMLRDGQGNPDPQDGRIVLMSVGNPALGDGSWYLVRSRNGCGSGTWGNSSLDPDPRDLLDAAPACS